MGPCNIYNFKNVENILKYCNAIAIGGFDGMHNGHQKLFSELGNDGCIVVIETGYANLTPKKEREKFSGTNVRQLILDDKNWQDLVPKGAQKVLEKIKAKERLKNL